MASLTSTIPGGHCSSPALATSASGFTVLCIAHAVLDIEIVNSASLFRKVMSLLTTWARKITYDTRTNPWSVMASYPPGVAFSPFRHADMPSHLLPFTKGETGTEKIKRLPVAPHGDCSLRIRRRHYLQFLSVPLHRYSSRLLASVTGKWCW